MAKKHGFINVDFDPDLRTVEQDFRRVSRNLEHKEQVMIASMAVAQADIEEMFEGEHDAFGDDWQYWKQTKPPSGGQSYASRAENYPNIGILVQDGDLHREATSRSQFVISDSHLSYGHDLPEWAGVHLHGGVKIQPDGYVIPQRSFYPYSPEGVQKVHMLFDEWAENAIEIKERTSKRGKRYVQIQTRTPGGQYGASPIL
jgi:phage gpG-like protein